VEVQFFGEFFQGDATKEKKIITRKEGGKKRGRVVQRYDEICHFLNTDITYYDNNFRLKSAEFKKGEEKREKEVHREGGGGEGENSHCK